MIRLHFDLLNMRQSVRQNGDSMQFRFAVVYSGDQRTAQMQCCTRIVQSPEIVKDQTVVLSGEAAVLFRIDGLDVEQKQVRERQKRRIAVPGSVPAGFQTGVQTVCFCLFQQFERKRELCQRLATRKRHSAARILIKRTVPEHFRQYLFRGFPFAAELQRSGAARFCTCAASGAAGSVQMMNSVPE